MADVAELAIWQQQQDFTAASLNAMRKNQFLTDLVIVCDGKDLPVHRTFLCASSPFFQAMFKSECKESLTGRMELPTIQLQTAETVLDFLYTGKIPNIAGDRERLKCLVEASHLLQLNCLFKYSLQQLRATLCQTYFLELWELAELYNDAELQRKIPSFIAKHFLEVSSTTEFVNMSASQLLQVIQDPNMSLWVADVNLEGIMNWVKIKQDVRECEFEGLFALVDIKHISAELLRACLEDPMIKCNSSLSARIHKEISRRFVEQICEPKLLCFETGEKYNVMTAFNAKKMTWAKEVALPKKLFDDQTAVASLNGNVYFVGGGNLKNNSSSATVYKYSLVANMSVKKVDLKNGVSLAGAAALDYFVYVVGGRGTANAAQKTVQRINTLDGTNEVVSCTNFAHTSPIVFTFQKQLYAFGSQTNDESAVEKYDPAIDQWTVVTDIPSSIRWCRGAVCGEKLFLVSYLYRTKELKAERNLLLYDFTSDSWVERYVETGPTSVYGMWATNANSIIILDGVGVIYTYDVEKNKWLKGGKGEVSSVSFNLVTFIK